MSSWDKYVRRVVPYVPGDQPKGENLVKLNTNENPYPPAPGVREALLTLSGMYEENLRKYPDPCAADLVEALAARYGLEKDQIFVGVGSDDVLAMCFLTFFGSEKPILFPKVSYSFYEVWAGLYGIPYKEIPLDEEMRICPEDYKIPNGGIIFPNPNAPTGLLLPVDAVEEIAAANPDSVVIVDEAYIDFGGRSALPLTARYDNVLVVQTFSKSRSLAGLRIGFAMGDSRLIKALNDVKFSFNSYTLGAPSIILGSKALEDQAYFDDTVGKIISTREDAKRRLHDLGFSFPDSAANFIFAKHAEVPAKLLYEELKARQIYVRYFAREGIDNFLRITVGTPDQMERLYAALAEIIKKTKETVQ